MAQRISADVQASHLLKQTHDFLQTTVLEPIALSTISHKILQRDWTQQVIFPKVVCSEILPVLTCQLAGGTVEQALPLSAFWWLNLFAARLLDDLQDGDITQSWEKQTPAQRLSAAIYGLGAAQYALSFLDADAKCHQSLYDAFGRTLALAAVGQYQPSPRLVELSIASYFETIILKSANLFAAICWAGARLVTVDETVLAACSNFGLAVGIMKQLQDDCTDFNDSESSDLARGSYTLPVIYALSQTNATEEAIALWDSQAILQLVARTEGIQWCQQMARIYRQQALDALSIFPAEKTDLLKAYVFS